MNITELNELIKKRKEELLANEYSYTLYTELSYNWKNLLEFLESKKMRYNEQSKNKFLEKQANSISHKRYLYTLHSIEALEDINLINLKSHTKKTEIKLSEYNKRILKDYNNEIENYNSLKTVNVMEI